MTVCVKQLNKHHARPHNTYSHIPFCRFNPNRAKSQRLYSLLGRFLSRPGAILPRVAADQLHIPAAAAEKLRKNRRATSRARAPRCYNRNDRDPEASGLVRPRNVAPSRFTIFRTHRHSQFSAILPLNPTTRCKHLGTDRWALAERSPPV